MKNEPSKKEEFIERITERIREYGSFNTGEVFADCSPCVNSMQGNVVQLAEKFFVDHVEAVIYANNREVSTCDIPYNQLSPEVL